MKKLKELIIELILRYKLHSRKIYNPNYDNYEDDKIRFLYRGFIFNTIEEVEQARTDKMINQGLKELSMDRTILALVKDSNDRTYYRIIQNKEQLFAIKGQITLIAKEL